jgi:hypothetical protein
VWSNTNTTPTSTTPKQQTSASKINYIQYQQLRTYLDIYLECTINEIDDFGLLMILVAARRVIILPIIFFVIHSHGSLERLLLILLQEFLYPLAAANAAEVPPLPQYSQEVSLETLVLGRVEEPRVERFQLIPLWSSVIVVHKSLVYGD